MTSPESSRDNCYRYDAFISYRQVEPDRHRAKWLHTGLETYRTPRSLVDRQGVPRRAARVFQDEEELPASSDLSREIETALRESRFLIVVCSRRTPESQWVDKEVVRVRELGRDDRILALPVDGEPSEAFPVSLREIRRMEVSEDGESHEHVEGVEPLAADVRGRLECVESESFLHRMAKLRILACLLGCTFDDLRGRDHERRVRRLAFLGVSGVTAFLILMILSILAFTQRKAALTSREEEVARQKKHNALVLAEGSSEVLETGLKGAVDQARALALDAVALDACPRTHRSLHEAVRMSSYNIWGSEDLPLISSVAFSNDGRFVALGSSVGGECVVVRSKTGKVAARFDTREPVVAVRFSADDSSLVVLDQVGWVHVYSMPAWNLLGGSRIPGVDDSRKVILYSGGAEDRMGRFRRHRGVEI